MALDKFLIRKILKGKIYKAGLTHNIYRSGNLIVKIPKSNFPEFNTRKHFLTEKNSLRMLSRNGISTPKKIKEINIGSREAKKYCLVESYIEGKQFASWEELKKDNIKELFKIYKKCHRITVKNFGQLNQDLVGEYSNWGKFLINSINSNRDYFNVLIPKYKLNYIFEYLLVRIEELGLEKKVLRSRFLILDLNPGNIFFDNDGRLLSIIDIDHPVGGDELYDFSSLLWYSQETFERLQKNFLMLNQEKIERLNFYLLLRGTEIIIWMYKHKIDVSMEIRKLKKLYKSIRFQKTFE